MPIDDIRNKLQEILSRAMESARKAGELDIQPSAPQVDVPKDSSFGDFSTNVAMALAKSARRSPRDVAGIILKHFSPPDGLLVSAPELVGAGFINFRISPDTWRGAITKITEMGRKYGNSDIGGGEKVMVEFVSANPTGPLHIGHARGAAIGDSLARILKAAGYEVKKEFYVNDAGAQVEMLAKSVHARWLETQGHHVDWERVFPDGNYYPGNYVLEIAQQMPIDAENLEKMEKIEAGYFDVSERDWAVREIREWIRQDLLDFGVEFNRWFFESELYKNKIADSVLEKLKDQGDIYEKDGAVWFKVSKYQPDEEDRVIRKSSGEWTYFASDIAYHADKLRRGFERLINIWGADHHGYIPRVKASLQAMGLPPDKLQVLLVQMVSLVRGGEPVRMGKRTGEFVTLREVMEEVGADAMRFTFLTRSSDSQLNFDIDTLKAKPGEDSELKMSQLREKNPVYYVQYAHARANAIFRKAALRIDDIESYNDADYSKLTLPEEIYLARKLESFPREVATAATAAEPHRISHYLIELAGDFHRYYYLGDRNPSYRVLAEDETIGKARLAIVAAVATVIHNGLDLLGVEAPERM